MKNTYWFILCVVLLSCKYSSVRAYDFNTKAVISSADIDRNQYSGNPAISLYQGNGKFGSSYASLGLHIHPDLLSTHSKYGNTQLMHMEHMGRGKFGSDYVLPLLRVYWEKNLPAISEYNQHQSFYDGVISTSFKSNGNRIEVKSWFDTLEKDLACLFIRTDMQNLTVIIDPCQSFKVHYGQDLTQLISITKGKEQYIISLDCLGKHAVVYVKTNAIIEVKDKILRLTLQKGENRIQFSYKNQVETSIEKSLARTVNWWNNKWEETGCIQIPDENAQKMWVRSMAMFLSSYSKENAGLSLPMGLTGNGWPFPFPQDISFVHPVLLSTGNVDIMKSLVENFSKNTDGMKKYTQRLIGVDGIMCPWVFPYGDFDGYHDPTPPNKFYYETHNSGYLAKIAHETAVYVDDKAWTEKYVLPLIKETAAFYKNICKKGEDGLWHLFVKPSMGQDERGGENQKDYLCALYSAKYCFQKAIHYNLDKDNTYHKILADGLAFETLKSDKGYYYSCAGRGAEDFGKQKHPVQLNELAFLPVEDKVSKPASIAYNLRYAITRDANVPYFYGWSLGEFLLAGSRYGDADQWLKDWNNLQKSNNVDDEWIQVYETSGSYANSFYNITNGLISQSLVNNLVCDWYGKLEIGKCNPWKGKVRIKDIHSLLGVIVNGEIENGNASISLSAWKNTEIELNSETIKLKKGDTLNRNFRVL